MFYLRSLCLVDKLPLPSMLFMYQGRSVNSRTDNDKNTTVNHTILTVMLHFNIVSLQFNTAFPSFN